MIKDQIPEDELPRRSRSKAAFLDFSRLLVAGVEVEADERLRFDVLLLFDFTFEFSSFPDLFFFFFLDLAFFSVYLKTKLHFIFM